MPKPIENPCEDEPSALPFRTGGRLRRNQEYVIFYFLAIGSWGCEIAAAALGSLNGAQSHGFIATITPFLVLHWYGSHLFFFQRKTSKTCRLSRTDQISNRSAFLQTCWLMATARRETIGDRMSYLNLACRFQRLCAVSSIASSYSDSYLILTQSSSQPLSLAWSPGQSPIDSATKPRARLTGSFTWSCGS
jgi:hypothetical protein